MSTNADPIDFSLVTTQVGTEEETMLVAAKAYLGLTDTSQDIPLARAINLAGIAVEAHVDRILAKRPVTEYYRHHFGTVQMAESPVDASVAIVVNLNGNPQSDYTAWYGRGQKADLSRTGHSPDVPFDWRQYDQVSVAYTAGYSPLPSDLAQAIVYTSADIFSSEGTGSAPGGSSGDVKSMSIQDVGSISYDVSGSSSGGGDYGSAGQIPDTAAQMLQRYKRMFA